MLDRTKSTHNEGGRPDVKRVSTPKKSDQSSGASHSSSRVELSARRRLISGELPFSRHTSESPESSDTSDSSDSSDSEPFLRLRLH
ncbi:unnamed protein product [Knipowitschia caucasica]|uniref:Uncharacterized protein n=1 Tax=Knipowitschia caucasica TaxID=637954 RepID=A0AAV2MKE8_KNICA